MHTDQKEGHKNIRILYPSIFPHPPVFRKVSPIAFQNHPRNLISKPVEVPVRPRGHYPAAQGHGVDGHAGELGVEVMRGLGALSLVAAGVEGGRDALRQQGGPVEAPEEVVVHHLSNVCMCVHVCAKVRDLCC